jgi:hypothetical protein
MRACILNIELLLFCMFWRIQFFISNPTVFMGHHQYQETFPPGTPIKTLRDKIVDLLRQFRMRKLRTQAVHISLGVHDFFCITLDSSLCEPLLTRFAEFCFSG